MMPKYHLTPRISASLSWPSLVSHVLGSIWVRESSRHSENNCVIWDSNPVFERLRVRWYHFLSTMYMSVCNLIQQWSPNSVLHYTKLDWNTLNHFSQNQLNGRHPEIVCFKNQKHYLGFLPYNKFVTVDSIPLKDTVPSVSAALPITPCSDRSIGILLIIQCLNWRPYRVSIPVLHLERVVI